MQPSYPRARTPHILPCPCTQHPDFGKKENPTLEEYINVSVNGALEETDIPAEEVQKAWIGNFAGELFCKQGLRWAVTATRGAVVVRGPCASSSRHCPPPPPLRRPPRRGRRRGLPAKCPQPVVGAQRRRPRVDHPLAIRSDQAHPGLYNKSCMRVEGACASGGAFCARRRHPPRPPAPDEDDVTDLACPARPGLAFASAVESIQAGTDVTLVVGAEVQTTASARQGGDYLARASHYRRQKALDDFVFPALFARRVKAPPDPCMTRPFYARPFSVHRAKAATAAG